MIRTKLPSESMLSLACQYLGLQEISGQEDNPIIVNWFAEIGHKWVKDDETAWCSCFMNWLALKCGLERSGKLDARSWLQVGISATNPVPGDIVVFWRETKTSWKGHVGLFAGYSLNGDVYCLGGNQSNEVNIAIYKKARLLDFRRLDYEKH